MAGGTAHEGDHLQGLPAGAELQAASRLTRCARRLASRNRAAAAYAGHRLAAIITRGDWPAAEAVPLAAVLGSGLGKADVHGRARIILLLGILAERSPDVRDTMEAALGEYLALMDASACGSPEYLALLYLLAHFPGERDRIMAVAGRHSGDDPAGISRLDRTLREPDPSDPRLRDEAGRAWPSPAFLAVTAAEIEATSSDRDTQPLERPLVSAAADRAALMAYAGGRAVAGGA